MPRIPITHLFNAYDLQINPLVEDKIRSQEVVNYCEARFRVALQAMMQRSEQDRKWMYRLLYREMELCFSYIGVAAAIGQPLHIPVIVRSLGQDMYRVGMIPHGGFRPGLELMSYLDGNLSSNGVDDPALAIGMFHLPWWTSPHAPNNNPSHLCSESLKSALDKYRSKLEATLIPFGVPHFVRSLADELNKPAYTWHSSANDKLPNSPTDCTRCRLYRAVAVGVMDQLRDTYNMVHACEIANEAEKDIAIRRASGFNELFEAVSKKECEESAESGEESESGSSKGKEKERFGPEVENLKTLTKELILEAAEMAASKWTWGIELTEDDLRGLIRGADRRDAGPHSGYDDDLPSDSLQSQTSALDPRSLEDPDDQDLRFDELSRSITIISELRPHEIPTYSAVLLAASDTELVDSEPDPVIEAFTKVAKARLKANKLLMQDEVDRPASFRDYGSEFVPHTALIPRRPWLAPRLPIISAPTNNATRDMPTDSDTDDNCPDHIIIPASDDQIDLLIPDSDALPASDEDSDAMDVIRSDEQQMSVDESEAGSDLHSDDIIFPESPVAMRQSTGGSGVTVGIKRDAHTGRFTAASFTNFPDELLD